MTGTFVVTPANWFDLPRRAMESAANNASLDLALRDADGRVPLADVALGELRAVHHTFGDWWPALGGAERPSSLGVEVYGRFLADSRALLRERAEAALAQSEAAVEMERVLVAFPSLDHALLQDPGKALPFLQRFLVLWPSASLTEWARAHASRPDAVSLCSAHAWLRVVLQKIAVEARVPEALACLRGAYQDEAGRGALVAQERELLESHGLADLAHWSRALGIDRPPRTEPGLPASVRRSSERAGAADVTVIVPSHCHEAFIESTLESIVAQTHSALRILVVDDCSTDATVERALRNRDERLRIERNDRNLGLGGTVLRALDCVTTPYIAVLNSDDLYHPERLERCLAVLEHSARAQIVATGIVPIDTSGCRLTSANVRRLFDGGMIADWIGWFSRECTIAPGVDLLRELLARNFLVTSSNIVGRTEFVRGNRERLEGLKYCLDWQLFLDAATDDALAYLPQELVGYRLHPSNTVWFDEAGQAGYALEVNRVLACTARRLVERGRPVADIVGLLRRDAAQHAAADGLALHAIELLGWEALAAAMREFAATKEPEHARAARSGADDELTAERLSARLMAMQTLGDVLREEVQVVRDTERWTSGQLEVARNALQLAQSDIGRLSAELRRAEAELARLLASPEWVVGDALWNKAHLASIGRPTARVYRWAKR